MWLGAALLCACTGLAPSWRAEAPLFAGAWAGGRTGVAGRAQRCLVNGRLAGYIEAAGSCGEARGLNGSRMKYCQANHAPSAGMRAYR